LKRLGRRGLASAAIEGLQQSQAIFLAVMDSDLQHDETLLKEMIRLLKSEPLDVVIASRYVDNAQFKSWSKGRVAISRVATGIVRIVSRVKMKDPLSGFFMMKREFFTQAVPSLCGRGQKILLDLYLSSPDKARFKELPFQFKGRVSGKSKLSLIVIWENFCLLVTKLCK